MSTEGLCTEAVETVVPKARNQHTKLRQEARNSMENLSTAMERPPAERKYHRVQNEEEETSGFQKVATETTKVRRRTALTHTLHSHSLTRLVASPTDVLEARCAKC